jgi:hypothetical protein
VCHPLRLPNRPDRCPAGAGKRPTTRHESPDSRCGLSPPCCFRTVLTAGPCEYYGLLCATRHVVLRNRQLGRGSSLVLSALLQADSVACVPQPNVEGAALEAQHHAALASGPDMTSGFVRSGIPSDAQQATLQGRMVAMTDEGSSIDRTKPSIARVYDYLLGGKDNYAVDREIGDVRLGASHRCRVGPEVQSADSRRTPTAVPEVDRGWAWGTAGDRMPRPGRMMYRHPQWSSHRQRKQGAPGLRPHRWQTVTGASRTRAPTPDGLRAGWAHELRSLQDP